MDESLAGLSVDDGAENDDPQPDADATAVQVDVAETSVQDNTLDDSVTDVALKKEDDTPDASA